MRDLKNKVVSYGYGLLWLIIISVFASAIFLGTLDTSTSGFTQIINVLGWPLLLQVVMYSHYHGTLRIKEGTVIDRGTLFLMATGYTLYVASLLFEYASVDRAFLITRILGMITILLSLVYQRFGYTNVYNQIRNRTEKYFNTLPYRQQDVGLKKVKGFQNTNKVFVVLKRTKFSAPFFYWAFVRTVNDVDLGYSHYVVLMESTEFSRGEANLPPLVIPHKDSTGRLELREAFYHDSMFEHVYEVPSSILSQVDHSIVAAAY